MGHDATAPRIAVILVVDQVGSTSFLVTHGEAEAGRVTAEQGDAVHHIVDAMGGRVEASTGDGYVASFGLGSAALDAAVEIQRVAERLSAHYPEPVQLRVGVAIGEVHHDGAELRGWPFFLATRLCDSAPDGAILVSTTLLDVVATRSTHALGQRHTLTLKGVGEPTDAIEIEWQTAHDDHDVALDPDLAVLDQRPWVGRTDTVRALLDAVTAEHRPGLVVVAGEPGAGKSRLIARVAAEATAHRHPVLYGSAPRDPRSSYEPVITALRSALTALPPDVRSSVLVGSAGRELTRLLPDLGGPGREILRVAEGPGANRLLLEAIGEVLARLAEHAHGVTFVIDDVQWADDETMATIRHLAGPDRPERVGVVAVIRAADTDRLTELMADAARRSDLLQLDVAGLSADEIAELVSHGQPGLGEDEISRAADYLANRTGGNALFVTSLVQHPDWLDADLTGDGESQLPVELSVAIAERLASLDPADVATLTSASVIGQRFAARQLVDIAGVTPDQLAATIGRARQAGLLQDLGAGDVGFVHDLVRRALLPAVDSFERAVIHRAVAERFDHEPEPDVA
ncbi:MAG: AAA family ATPase, partial [Acidimicrobiia bacterium]|nr:AAA family ATPase [Acidimicrobiia bacterium]